MAWSKKRPGYLPARCLQKMEDCVGRDGELAAWDSLATPASAKSYFLRVAKPAAGTLRNSRDMETLCVMLDHLAQGRNASAADVVAIY